MAKTISTLSKQRGGARAQSHSADESRKALLSAAKYCFARKGFDGTSVKDIAQKAKLNVSLVSYYFGGKEALYCACLEEFALAKLGVADRILQPPSSLEEFSLRSKMFMEEMMLSCQSDPDVTRIIDRDIHMEDNHISEKVFRESFLKIFDRTVLFFRGAQKNGVLNPNVDPSIAASLFFGLLMQQVRMDHLGERYYGFSLKDPNYRNKVFETLSLFITEGIGPKKKARR